nr:MAG TPA: hypothetical protein [Caudoviricetes sp.]
MSLCPIEEGFVSLIPGKKRWRPAAKIFVKKSESELHF